MSNCAVIWSAPRMLAIRTLVRDPRFQARQQHRPTVRRYERCMRNGNVFPAVTVGDIAGVLYLLDGWHRVAALERCGHVQVPAMVARTSAEGAAWLAVEANLRHGLPLLGGHGPERRAAFDAYMAAGQYRLPDGRVKDSREIAGDLGDFTVSLVQRWAHDMHPKLYARAPAGPGDEEDGV